MRVFPVNKGVNKVYTNPVNKRSKCKKSAGTKNPPADSEFVDKSLFTKPLRRFAPAPLVGEPREALLLSCLSY